MSFLLWIGAAVTGASIGLTILLRGVLFVFRRRPAGFWRRAAVAHLVLVPFYLFLVAPAVLGGLARQRVGTRGDERGYAGPRIAPDGTWVRQSRATLKDEAAGAAVDPELLGSARAATHMIKAADGVASRAFLVGPRSGTPRCSVVLVHGLFRGGLELEAPAMMFRDLGAEVLMLEMRNHGGSDRSPLSFGLRESQDVVAAAAWLRQSSARADRPLVLFAVSLGTAAAMLAAPEVPRLGGLVLDAPMDDLLATAHRMMSEEPRPGRRGLAIVQPFRTLTILSLEAWNGFRFSAVRPIDELARLGADLPVLVIGGGDDARMPPASVRGVFERVRSRPDRKSLWIREGSDHGQVWTDDPDEYRRRLATFLDLVIR